MLRRENSFAQIYLEEHEAARKARNELRQLRNAIFRQKLFSVRPFLDSDAAAEGDDDTDSELPELESQSDERSRSTQETSQSTQEMSQSTQEVAEVASEAKRRKPE